MSINNSGIFILFLNYFIGIINFLLIFLLIKFLIMSIVILGFICIRNVINITK